MNTPSVKSGIQLAGTFLVATLASSLFFARTAPQAMAADAAKAPRGEPIKPLAPRGEPIKPLQPAPAAPAATPSPGCRGRCAGKGELLNVGFDKLSAFKYEVPEQWEAGPGERSRQADSQNVKDFGGKRVSLKGFMLPLKVEGGLVTELLIMRDQSMCC